MNEEVAEVIRHDGDEKARVETRLKSGKEFHDRRKLFPFGIYSIPESHKVFCVHIIGTGATELIHIGQAVMVLDATVDYFVDSVFNYPTLAECYRVAALNGINKLG